MDFKQELEQRVRYAEQTLASYMPKERTLQKTVVEAMEYTVFAGGKRIRPVLMKAVFDLFEGRDISGIEPFMAAMEMIHTYSLIHDDLPALDNDDYRRGRKTAHVVYGEAMAILAGDSLLNYAYETAVKALGNYASATEDWLEEGISKEEQSIRVRNYLRHQENVKEALSELTEKAGIYGMIGGQVADVELTGTGLTDEQLHYIYENKTGALIKASMMIGALVADAGDSQIEKIEKIAYNIGMAFQIQDDILDETASFEELGKPIHSDEKNEKVTYVSLYGLAKAGQEVERLSNEAVSLLEELEGDTAFLKELILYLIHREK